MSPLAMAGLVAGLYVASRPKVRVGAVELTPYLREQRRTASRNMRETKTNVEDFYELHQQLQERQFEDVDEETQAEQNRLYMEMKQTFRNRIKAVIFVIRALGETTPSDMLYEYFLLTGVLSYGEPEYVHIPKEYKSKEYKQRI